jgi:hypothetical protein
LLQTSHQEGATQGSHGENLQNTHDVVLYLQRSMSQPHASYEGARKDVRRVFWEVKEGDLNKTRGFDCKTMVGSRNMHSMQAVAHQRTSF